MTDFWAGFSVDPRDPRHAGLRAADADRGVVTSLLDEAYADGRLTREEHDDRVDQALVAVTLGDLPPLVADLLPPSSPGEVERRSAAESPLRQQAEAAYRRARQQALAGFLFPSLVCLVIWAVLMPGVFFWPAFVMIGTGGRFIATITRKEEFVEHTQRQLERRRRREVEERGGEEKPPEEG